MYYPLIHSSTLLAYPLLHSPFFIAPLTYHINSHNIPSHIPHQLPYPLSGKNVIESSTRGRSSHSPLIYYTNMHPLSHFPLITNTHPLTFHILPPPFICQVKMLLNQVLVVDPRIPLSYTTSTLTHSHTVSSHPLSHPTHSVR